MRLYVDTEFDGFGGDLISMAIVSADGHEWYGIRRDVKINDPWVREHVAPVLLADKVHCIAHDDEWRYSLHSFLEQFDNPTIIADWYTDLVHFFECFKGPDHSMTFVYPCKAELRLIDKYDSKTPHNALSDARAIRDAIEGKA